MRTKAEIERQVKGLEKMKKSLPEVSGFGDNNWEAIEAQISLIEGSTTLDDYDESEESEHLYSQLMDADMWLSGDSNDDLFE